MHALLIGNYGVGNFGDEALKEYFVSAFSDVEWTIVTATPHPNPLPHGERGHVGTIRSSPSGGEDSGEGHLNFVPRLPFGFRSIFTPWWRTLRALRRCDIVVFGGGTLFTDIESPLACALWRWHAFVARCCGKKYVLAFQGIGPFRTKRGERRARWAVQHATHVSVRDDASLTRAKQWRSDITLAFDPALSYFADFMGPVRHGGKTLIVIPRENPTDVFFLKVKQRKIDARFTGARILSFKPDDEKEKAACKKLQHMFPLPAGEGEGEGLAIIPIRTIADLERGLMDASLILTQRYHGAIAALAGGVPFETVSQGAGDKLSTLSGRSRDELLSLVHAGKQALRQSMSGATLRS